MTETHRNPGTATGNVNVCATTQWTAPAGTMFIWDNTTGGNVTVSQSGNSTFPFVATPGQNSIVIPPGLHSGQLISTKGTFPYNSDPCSGLGNPKTVVIT